MPLQALYIKKELHELLKAESNMSGLVNELLQQHFNTTKPLADNIKEKEEKIASLKAELEKLEVVYDNTEKAKSERLMEERKVWEEQKQTAEYRMAIRKQYEEEVFDPSKKTFTKWCEEKGINF